MFTPQEQDAEEEDRVRRALAQADRAMAERLFAATKQGSYERLFLQRDPTTLDQADRRLLTRLAWHYRRQLPGWLRPKTNPDDPIVRENETAHG